MDEARSARLSPGEQALLGLALLLPLAWVFWARGLWMPGWASVDEAGRIGDLQLWREGWPLPLRLGAGCLHRGLQLLALEVLGWRVESLRALSFAFYLAESWALYAVARAWFGSRAALWALCVNAFSAVTFTRLGSVLWFQMVPLEWLLLAAALLRWRGPWAALGWGALAALFLLDYEGWLLALPSLAVLGWQGFDRRSRWAALAGLLLGCAGVAALNRAWFQASYLVRADQSLPSSVGDSLSFLWQHLRALVFGGGRALPYLGVPDHPQLAPWAWLGFFAAIPLWRRHRALGLAALLPLASLALHAPGVEPNRCLASWPLFCLFCGAGFARLARGRGQRALALALLALLGAAWEMRAYSQGLQRYGTLFYGESQQALEAGRFLRQGAGSCTLLSDLGPGSGADLRFATGLPPQRLQEGPLVAVIPWQDQPRLDGKLGDWKSFQSSPEAPPLLLLAVSPSAAPELLEADRHLAALWPRFQSLPADQILRLLEDETRPAIPNARLRTALWEARFKMARYVGQALPDEGSLALRLHLLRVDPLLRGARQASTSPEEALQLLSTATELDPRRREAWIERLDLLRSLGRQKELSELLSSLEKHPDWGLIKPVWLRD